MKTIGEILKKQRIRKRKSLKQVQLVTHIPLKTLTALEKDDFSTLPALPFIKGFIQIYADFLDLDPKKMVAIFRRDWRKKESNKIVPKGFTKRQKGQFWTPKTTVILTVVFIFLLFFFYLVFNYYLHRLIRFHFHL